MKYLTAQEVLRIHDVAINTNELQGLAGDKSLDAVIARIENRIYYGMIEDVFELAACYACYIAVGHVFNDANKRTAYSAMKVCLTINEVEISLGSFKEVGDMIIQVAQRKVDEKELALWLRRRAR
jgi:death-on-curing protein